MLTKLWLEGFPGLKSFECCKMVIIMKKITSKYKVWSHFTWINLWFKTRDKLAKRTDINILYFCPGPRQCVISRLTKKLCVFISAGYCVDDRTWPNALTSKDRGYSVISILEKFHDCLDFFWLSKTSSWVHCYCNSKKK